MVAVVVCVLVRESETELVCVLTAVDVAVDVALADSVVLPVEDGDVCSQLLKTPSVILLIASFSVLAPQMPSG